MKGLITMMSVAQFDATGGQNMDEETRLWSAYMIAVSNSQRWETEVHNTWRRHVTSNVPFSDWTTACDRWREARNREDEALVAWKRAAYPLHGFPLLDDEKAS